MWWVLLLLLAIGVLESCQAECNVCASSSNVACVSNTQFMFCENGLPILPVNSCPSGTFCSSEGSVCQATVAEQACSKCQMCNALKTFACMSVRTFALCLGGDTPSETITGSCAPSYVCNTDNPNICTAATLGSQATCPLVDDDLTTTLAPGAVVDPNTYCRNVQKSGRFPYGNTLETTCKQYILCYLNNNAWKGVLYNCPGATYFQTGSQLCNASIPATCTSGVRNLQVRNLRLS